MKELMLLDSDSTDTVFCNPKYVTNIRESNCRREVKLSSLVNYELLVFEWCMCLRSETDVILGVGG
jgi:hypothetical protein